MNIDKIISNLASHSGFNNFAASTSSKKLIEEKIASELGGAYSFSDLLCYKYYDEESYLFFNDDQHVGFLVEICPIVGCDEDIIKNLEYFFNNELQFSGYLQFLLVASHDINSILALWKKGRLEENKLLKKLETNRENFLKALAIDYQNFDGRIARNFKLYLSFSKKCTDSKDLSDLKLSLHIFKQKLETLNLNPRICNVLDLISLVREIIEPDINFSANKKYNSYDKHNLICDQILTPGRGYAIKEDRIDHISSKLSSKSFFVSGFPSEFHLSQMIELLGDNHRANLSLPVRFCISYSVANNLSSSAQKALIQKGEKVIESAEEWYSRNNRDIKREAYEWKDINDRAQNGEVFLTESFQIMITGPKDYIDKIEQNLISLYNIHNWRLEVNKHLQLLSLLSILPMQVSLMWKELSHFKLTRMCLAKEAIAKLPIHAEWLGIPKSGMLLIGRRGQLFNWNPFYRISSGNYNVCLFGPSGSGKSVFLQELATTMLAQNTMIFVLDIGQSFKNICLLLGGEIIQFGKDNDISLNPFSYLSDLGEEFSVAVSYAKSIVCSMCGVKGDNLKESIIEKAINKGIEEYGRDLDITKLAKVLYESDGREIAQNLSLSLFPYTSHGIHGKFFAKNKDTKFTSNLTIFEFEEIKNDTLLLAVVLQVIGMQIFMQILTGDRSRKFVLIVDEAWMILSYAARFLAEIARTIRKYGGSLVVCVQNFSDLQETEHHKSVLQNSTWTILLKQDEKGLNSFKESEAFKDIIPLIKSISIQHDKYAESLICATDIKVIGRLILDNYSKILYSTDAEVFSRLNKLCNDKTTMDEAISMLVEEKYGNVS